MPIPAKQIPAPNNTILSLPDNPEIQSLNTQITSLGKSSDTWNTAYLWLLFAAIVVSFVTLYAQYSALKLAKRRSDKQSELDAAKNRQLANELSKRDEAIATLNTEAAHANREAGRANESAGKANERAQSIENANLRLRNDLENAVAESRSKQAELEREQQRTSEEQRKTAEAQREAAKAELELKKYVNALALAQAPRAINEREFLAALKLAQPKKAEVLYQDGSSETYLFANSIHSLLGQAGWDVPQKMASFPSLIEMGGELGLYEIVVAMNRIELTNPFLLGNPKTTESALWKAILSLGRGGVALQDKSLSEDEFKIYVGPRLGVLLTPLK